VETLPEHFADDKVIFTKPEGEKDENGILSCASSIKSEKATKRPEKNVQFVTKMI